MSDIHAKHKSISNLRGFKSVEEMENLIVENVNKKLTKRDDLYHLGDFYWENDFYGIKNFIKRLTFRKLIFIVGNHDKPLINFMKKSKDSRFELHTDLFVKDNGYNLHLYHYPVEDWRKMIGKRRGNGTREEGSIMLHGHEHKDCQSVNRVMKNRLNVNVEFTNYEALNIFEIVDILKERSKNETNM